MILFLFIFREKKGGIEGEKHYCAVASHAPPTGDLAHNPGMCPDWESNLQPFGSQAGAQSTEPHQPGLNTYFSYTNIPRIEFNLLTGHSKRLTVRKVQDTVIIVL